MFTKSISEIVLIVQDVLASAHFYQEVVGLQAADRSGRSLGLVLDWRAGEQPTDRAAQGAAPV